MDNKRFTSGFGWGVVATIAMSTFMILGVMTGKSPLPKPIPLAIVSSILGESTPKPLLIGLAILSHLAYGGFWGALLATLTKRVTVGKGVGLGIFLWFVMQITVLPFVGWGIFGSAISPAIAVSTLVLHLIYGVILGWLVDRN